MLNEGSIFYAMHIAYLSIVEDASFVPQDEKKCHQSIL
jgi:hypothetical protein